MSASLFRSRQIKSKKSLKNLKISGPLSPDLSSQAIPKSFAIQDSEYAIIVLVAKYGFSGENPQELSIETKEYLKLIERLGNGWLKVSRLDNSFDMGLVPASYVDIAVNDASNPISLKWLHEYKQGRITDLDVKNDEDDEDVELYNKLTEPADASSSIYSNNEVFDFEHAYPKSVSIENVLKDTNGKFWYNLKFTMSNDDIVYVKKSYQQFYNIHIEFIKNYPDVDLAKLPQPIRRASLSSTVYDKSLVQDLNNLSSDLSLYIKRLIEIPTIKYSGEFHKFIYEQAHIKCKSQSEETDETLIADIIQRLSPNSIDINSPTTSAFSTTAPLPPPKSSKKSISAIQTRDDTSNYKYSTYIQQNKHIVPSTSSNTLSSYTSLIARYDDSYYDAVEQDDRETDERETSFTESEDSKDTSMVTRATSVESTLLSKRGSNDTQASEEIAEVEEDEEYEAEAEEEDVDVEEDDEIQKDMKIKSEFIESLKDLCPRDSSKFGSGHSSSNSESDIDSVFSSKTSVPSTPIIATSGFFATPDCVLNVTSPITPTSPIMEDNESESISPRSAYEYRMSRKSVLTPEKLKNRASSLESIISVPSHHKRAMSEVAPVMTFASPILPVKERATSVINCNAGDYIKIKIFLNNKEDDIVALKIKRNNLISIVYLKKLLSYKIYKDYNLVNHYRLQVSETDEEMDDEELLKYIKDYNKISLKLIRVRGSM
ncbi:hypothetical protein DFJ63DRAFT_206870 [Scheffersomyces coipomensis]|uniref:uncharacterized protein n=1 Tax=Scheffersomyces coipomensis TaxID=1788519 RepID=UPI00315C92A5